MEDLYTHQWALSTMNREGSGDIRQDQYTNYNQIGALPSFDTFKFRSDVIDAREKKNTTTETSVCDLQTSDSSEPSFSIESIMRADDTSGPRSSTPEMQVERRAAQTNSSVQDDVDANQQLALPRPASATESKTKPYRRNQEKPPFTYAAMCIVAIEISQEKALTLDAIRQNLQTMFPFFRGEYTGWRDSIRHCLSANKAFFKVETTATDRIKINLWMVDYQSVKPTMFRKNRRGQNSHLYREYLHEELGIQPLCPDEFVHVQQLGKPANKDITLPEQPCLGGASAVTAEACESEDFLRASKECGNDIDTRTELTSESFNGKRKCDSATEQNEKRIKTNHPSGESRKVKDNGISVNPTVDYMYPNSMAYTGHSKFGQHQMPGYFSGNAQSKSAYYQPTAHFGYHHRNMATQFSQSVYPYGNMPTQFSQPLYPYGTMNMPSYPVGHYPTRPYGTTSQDYTTYNQSQGMNAAMNLWYHRQCGTLPTRGNQRWYALPEDSTEEVVDLSLTPDKE